MNFTTVKACEEECKMTSGCVAFTTLAGAENTCTLKNKDHGAESLNSVAISVKMRCVRSK